MQVEFARKFKKQHQKSDKKIKAAFDTRLELFLKNSHHPALNNHALTGNYEGYRSINITGDWRAIFSQHLDQEENIVIIFELLGTHSQLYK